MRPLKREINPETIWSRVLLLLAMEWRGSGSERGLSGLGLRHPGMELAGAPVGGSPPSRRPPRPVGHARVRSHRRCSQEIDLQTEPWRGDGTMARRTEQCVRADEGRRRRPEEEEIRE